MFKNKQTKTISPVFYLLGLAIPPDHSRFEVPKSTPLPQCHLSAQRSAEDFHHLWGEVETLLPHV